MKELVGSLEELLIALKATEKSSAEAQKCFQRLVQNIKLGEGICDVNNCFTPAIRINPKTRAWLCDYHWEEYQASDKTLEEEAMAEAKEEENLFKD